MDFRKLFRIRIGCV